MMAENDDMQLVESIGGIDGTPLASDFKNVHMHGFVSACLITIASNLITIITTSNFATIFSNFAKVQV
jgi:hypothetical protein